jgi:hypothetical protein
MQDIDLNGLIYVLKSSIDNKVTQDVDHPFEIGMTYVIRTVTMINVGVLVAVHKQELVLNDACWIAETGLYSDFLKNGDIRECEPFLDGKTIIGRGSIVDAQKVDWKSPRVRK